MKHYRLAVVLILSPWLTTPVQALEEADLPTVADTVDASRAPHEAMQIASLPVSVVPHAVSVIPQPVVKKFNRHRKTRTHAFAVSKRFTSSDGSVRLRYPGGWQAKTRRNAVMLRTFGENGEIALLSVMKHRGYKSLDAWVNHDFRSSHRPADLTTRTLTTLADHPAIQIEGSHPKNPNAHIVEFYVQGSADRYYFVLLVAENKDWDHYTPDFRSMLNSLSLR